LNRVLLFDIDGQPIQNAQLPTGTLHPTVWNLDYFRNISFLVCRPFKIRNHPNLHDRESLNLTDRNTKKKKKRFVEF
jgi:hypothetical protein